MGSGCSHPRVRDAAEPKSFGAKAPRHALDLKWDDYEVPPFDVDTDNWERWGGNKLVPLLEHVDLVDLRYVIENTEAGRPVPRWQDLPLGARINASNLYRIQRGVGKSQNLAVLVLSYPWLDAKHPDKNVLTMKRLLPLLKAFLQGLGENTDARSTVGLLMDYCSLPQKSSTGEDDRCIDEKERFKKGLSGINQWYTHKCTTVIIYDVAMPNKESGHTNLRPHAARGWCSFELRASTLVKDFDSLWSLQGFEDGGSPHQYAGAMEAATKQISRPTPMIPERFSEVLRDGVSSGELAFTARADLEVVSEQYGKAFDTAFAEAEDLTYADLGWGDAEMIALAAVLAQAKRSGGLAQHGRVWVNGNPCGEAGLRALAEALSGTKCEVYALGTGCSEAGKEAVEKACKSAGIKLFI